MQKAFEHHDMPEEIRVTVADFSPSRSLFELQRFLDVL